MDFVPCRIIYLFWPNTFAVVELFMQKKKMNLVFYMKFN